MGLCRLASAALMDPNIEIGEAMGTSRQAAHKRYGRFVRN